MVLTDKDGYKSVDYSRLTPVLVEAIKELKAENESLEFRVKVSELENKYMKVEVEKIKEHLQLSEKK
mgnify:CR=1 FL=1